MPWKLSSMGENKLIGANFFITIVAFGITLLSFHKSSEQNFKTWALEYSIYNCETTMKI
jgi:hypothetical protein